MAPFPRPPMARPWPSAGRGRRGRWLPRPPGNKARPRGYRRAAAPHEPWRANADAGEPGQLRLERRRQPIADPGQLGRKQRRRPALAAQPDGPALGVDFEPEPVAAGKLGVAHLVRADQAVLVAVCGKQGVFQFGADHPPATDAALRDGGSRGGREVPHRSEHLPAEVDAVNPELHHHPARDRPGAIEPVAPVRPRGRVAETKRMQPPELARGQQIAQPDHLRKEPVHEADGQAPAARRLGGEDASAPLRGHRHRLLQQHRLARLPWPPRSTASWKATATPATCCRRWNDGREERAHARGFIGPAVRRRPALALADLRAGAGDDAGPERAPARQPVPDQLSGDHLGRGQRGAQRRRPHPLRRAALGTRCSAQGSSTPSCSRSARSAARWCSASRWRCSAAGLRAGGLSTARSSSCRS